MLPAAHRLRRSEHFGRAVRCGARSGQPSVVVHFFSAESGPSRVGFVVSRAVGGAVVRNKVRRRLRAIMAIELAKLPPHSDVVVRATAMAGTATFDELRTQVARALNGAISRSRKVGTKVAAQ